MGTPGAHWAHRGMGTPGMGTPGMGTPGDGHTRGWAHQGWAHQGWAHQPVGWVQPLLPSHDRPKENLASLEATGTFISLNKSTS